MLEIVHESIEGIDFIILLLDLRLVHALLLEKLLVLQVLHHFLR
jgi:hypothetical protein